MANSAGMFIAEGSSMNKPPAFSGDDYPYWADRMEMYIKSTQYRLWKIITEGDLSIIKPEAEWGNEKYSTIKLNNKAISLLRLKLQKSNLKIYLHYTLNTQKRLVN